MARLTEIYRQQGTPPLWSWDTPFSVSGVALKVLECDAAAKKPNGPVRVIKTRMGRPKSSISFSSPTPIHFSSWPSPSSALTDASTSRCPASRFPRWRATTTTGVAASSLPRLVAGTDGGAAASQRRQAAVAEGGDASRGSRRAVAADDGAASRVCRRAAAAYEGTTVPPCRSTMHLGGSSLPHRRPRRPPVRSVAPQPRRHAVRMALPPHPRRLMAHIAKSIHLVRVSRS
jgi:hypothetical protein